MWITWIFWVHTGRWEILKGIQNFCLEFWIGVWWERLPCRFPGAFQVWVLKLLETEGHRSCWSSKNNKDLQSEKILEMQLYPILHVTRWAWLTSAQKSLRQDGNWNHPSRFPCQSPHGSLALPSIHLGSVHAPSSGSQLGIYRSGCLHIISAECLCADSFMQNSYFGTLPVDKSCGKVWNGKKGHLLYQKQHTDPFFSVKVLSQTQYLSQPPTKDCNID